MLQQLETAWRSAQDQSGIRIPDVVDEEKTKKFFAAFEKSTGLRESQVVGMYLDWLRLSDSDALEVKARRSAGIAFCAYMVDRIERLVGAAGMATACHGGGYES